MVEHALQWAEPTFLALWMLLGCFWDVFEDWVDFGARECEGFGGAGGLREPIDSNRLFPVMSTFRIVLAAFETLQHMLDFRSSVLFFYSGSKLVVGRMNNHVCYEFCELLGCESKCLIWSFRLREVFWRTVDAYVFWLLTTCCLNACFLYSGHLLYDETCDPLQLAHKGFLACLFGHPL